MSTVECLSSANDLLAEHSALISRVRATQKYHRRSLSSLPSPPKSLIKLPLIPSPPPSPSPSPPASPLIQPKSKPKKPDLPLAKRARVARYENYVPEEETIRNDYSQRYVDGGEWPQNWVLGADPDHRFEEYPKQQRLLALKKQTVDTHSIPPTYLPISQISTLQPAKFDVILIDPPFSSSFTWNDLQDLPIPSLAADPSFVLLWVGSGAGEGLERGRELLARWGFRRCEDIVWVKMNHNSNNGPGTDPPTTSLMTRTKQHCLMGIRGTVRRSTDSWFVHCNVDTDVMIWEGDPDDPTLKPPETYTLVENFCLGLRRLEIFARGKTLRRGWVSCLAVGEEERIPNMDEAMKDGEGDRCPIPWDKDAWEANIKELASGGKLVVATSSDIEALRPKSPVRGGSANNNNSPNPTKGQQQQHQQQQHINMNMNMNTPMLGMQNQGPPAFAPNHPMMMPQMIAMANAANMEQMGLMGWPGGIPGAGIPGMNMMAAPQFQHHSSPQGFNPMQIQAMQALQGMQGMGMQGMQGMGGMGGWMSPETGFGDGVWNPAMMGMVGPQGMGMNGNAMNGGMQMDMGQWGPFGFQ